MRHTAKMRAVLEELRKQPARRVHNPALPGKAPWPHHPSTLAALVRHQLVKRDRIKNARRLDVDRWTITDAGQQALEPAERFREHRDAYLQRDVWKGGDYTTNRRDRIDELAIDSDHLDPDWQRQARERHHDTEDPRVRARRLARQARRTRTPGPVTTRQVDPELVREPGTRPPRAA